MTKKKMSKLIAEITSKAGGSCPDFAIFDSEGIFVGFATEDEVRSGKVCEKEEFKMGRLNKK